MNNNKQYIRDYAIDLRGVSVKKRLKLTELLESLGECLYSSDSTSFSVMEYYKARWLGTSVCDLEDCHKLISLKKFNKLFNPCYNPKAKRNLEKDK